MSTAPSSSSSAKGVFVSSLDYSNDTEYAISYWTFDPTSPKKLVFQHSTPAGRNPSWLTLKNHSFLFATNETAQGAVLSFRLSGANGELELINSVQAGGGATHLAVNSLMTMAFSSNYHGGSLSIVDVDQSSGQLTTARHIDNNMIIAGEVAHAHFVEVHNEDRMISLVDLGHDAIYQYSVESSTRNVSKDPVNKVQLPRGYGPRHLIIHPSAPYAYVLCEHACRVTRLNYDRETGILSLGEVEYSKSIINDISKALHTGDMASAAINVSSNGRFIYTSTRDIASTNLGRDCISVLRIDSFDTGEFEVVQKVPSRGIHPRFITLANGDSMLIVANKHSNNIAIFEVNPADGMINEASVFINESAEGLLVNVSCVVPVYN